MTESLLIIMLELFNLLKNVLTFPFGYDILNMLGRL